MAKYWRSFLAGGSYFFTVNLAHRRLALLTDDIVIEGGVRQMRARHSFTIEAGRDLGGPTEIGIAESTPSG